MMPVLILFTVMLILLMLGFPVAFTLGGGAILMGFIYFSAGLTFSSSMGGLLDLMTLKIVEVMDSQMLIAVPLFVYMGVMLEKSGLAEELLETMALLFGRMRGGMAIAVIIVGAILAASTGIVGATVVTMGLLSLPTMLRRGYSPEVATGSICASGTLGQIIPPSIVLILLASILQNTDQSVSIAGLFKAAMIPGLILVVFYILWILLLTMIRPTLVPAMPEEDLRKFRQGNVWRQVATALLPPLILMILVLGAIFSGLATPTKAAAVGALGAAILTIVKKKFTYDVLKGVMADTTHLSCMVFMILIGAKFFTHIFQAIEGDELIRQIILEAQLSPQTFLILVMVIIFIAGFFIDFIEITTIIVPIVAPIFYQFDVPLTWIGIIIAINLQTSFLTPPFGFSLFYLKGVAPPEVKTSHIYRGIIPYIIIQIIVIALVIIFPKSTTWHL